MKTDTGHYNVYRKNDALTVAGDVALMCERVSVFSLNEVQPQHRKAVRRVLRKHGFKSNRKTTNMLCWNRDVWQGYGIKRSFRLCKAAPIPAHPARYLLSRQLMHRSDRSIHRFNVTHLPQGYAKPDGGGKTHAVAAHEDWQARTAVKNLQMRTRRFLLLEPDCYHHLLGDMNARIANDDEDWYPGVALADDWDLIDAPQNRIDWIVIAKRSVRRGMRIIKRWTGTKSEGFDSDHKAQFARVEW